MLKRVGGLRESMKQTIHCIFAGHFWPWTTAAAAADAAAAVCQYYGP